MSAPDRIATLDPSFAGGVINLQSLLPAHMQLNTVGNCIVLDDQGILVSATTFEAGTDFTDSILLKLKPTGALDPRFGGGKGYVIEDHKGAHTVKDTWVQSLGGSRFVAITQLASTTHNDVIPSLAIYSADGTLDTGFNGGRLIITTLPPLGQASGETTLASTLPTPNLHVAVIQSTGAITFNFRHYAYQAEARDYVIQVTAQGTLDLTLQQRGFTQVSYAAGVHMALLGLRKLADGKLLITGEINGQAALAKLLPSGAPDTTFSAGGFKLLDRGIHSALSGLFITANEKIRVIGVRMPSSQPGQLDRFIQGFNADGSDDAAFTTTQTDFGPGTLTSGGPIDSTVTDNLLWCLATVTTQSETGRKNQVLLSRLLPDGQPDTRFGNAGSWLVPGRGFARALAIQRDLKSLVLDVNEDSPAFNLRRYLV